MADIPQAEITAAGNALRQRWLRERPNILHRSFGLDPMEWAKTALEAAAAVRSPVPSVVIKIDGQLDETSMAKVGRRIAECLRQYERHSGGRS